MTSPSTVSPSTFDQLSEDALTERSERAGEPSWLLERRLEAHKRFLDQPWPDSSQDEFWRSTPFSKRFDVSAPLVADEPGEVSVATLLSELESPAASVTIVDGVVTDVTVPTEVADRGVVVTDLATAALEHPELVREHLGSLTTSTPESSGGDEDRTVTANDAAWTAGAFVHVPADVELDEPIGVHVHVTRPGAHLPRVLVVVDHHAAAKLYLEHTGGAADEHVLVDEVLEAIVGDGARLDMASLQEWDDSVAHLSLQKVAAHKDASVRHLSVTMGGATVRLRPECDLLGPGADVRPLGVYFADEGQWFDLQPYVRHLAPRATSDVLFKGALQGHSRTVFRGNIFVHKDAVGTDTDENNKSLILTEGARADATPFLEIECADIVAGHGSATGQIDALQLYYLTSRGIPREQALRLIVTGFFREVFSGVQLPGVEEAALERIDALVDAADLSSFQINDASLQDLRDEE